MCIIIWSFTHKANGHFLIARKNMEQTMSPLPVSKKSGKTMDFLCAIKEVVIGKKIHKLEWVDKEFYGFLNDDILSLHKPDGKNYQWIISNEDLIGNDYIVI